MASALVQECLAEARSGGKAGVAVVTSEGPWMAGPEVFLKNGLEEVDAAPPHFKLLARRLGSGPEPRFPTNWEERLGGMDDLRLMYTNQCPYIGKAVTELPPVARRYGMELRLIELADPAEAREKMPSPYGVMSLVYRGRLLADHAISATRFRNILEKELGLKARDR
jgi:hypothetical protein